jgi:subtilisin family serine protease
MGKISFISIAVLLFTAPFFSVLGQSPSNRPIPEFEQGEVLFLLKDNISLKKIDYKNARIGVSQLDQILQEFEVKNLDALFPNLEDYSNKPLPTLRNAYTNQDIPLANLHRTFKVKLPKNKEFEVFELIEALKQANDVVYAEPNYIFKNQLTETDPTPTRYNSFQPNRNGTFVPNDPLFSQQLGIKRHQVDQVWQTNKGNGKSIIAVIDTGVDYNHPDLAANIWKNPKESANANGNDTDGNGFIDDIQGWDFINNDKDPMDDNMHGTHVAGILAAVCDNGIGISGVNCNAKIMPLKAFQSSGRGDASTIAKAILYAANNGATVINMSFGSYAESITMRNALAFAYSKAVLVAAAGNDGRCIGPGRCPDGQIGAPMFPGAYSFVLGVQENTGGQTGSFSNFDQNGPIFSGYPDLWNYEIKASGINVLSTVPNGQYRALNGTSMAAPYVAGAVSLYLEERATDSKELLFGNLINSSQNGELRLKNALATVPEPRLEFVTFEIDDKEGGDGDKRPDAGETIKIIGTVRNTWGQADSVFMALSFEEFEDTSTVDFLVDSVFVGSISSYATKKNDENTFKIRLKNSLAHDRDIRLKVKIWDIDRKSEVEKELILTVYNKTKVGGLIDRNTTWTADREYLVVENLRVAENATLTIEPGTTITFDPNKSIDVRGKLIAKGTYDKTIRFTGVTSNTQISAFMGIRGPGILELVFCEITNLNGGLDLGNALSFMNDSKYQFNFFNGGNIPNIRTSLGRNLFNSNKNIMLLIASVNGDNNPVPVSNNIFSNNEGPPYYDISIWFYTFNKPGNFLGNTFVNNKKYNLDYYPDSYSSADLTQNYFGTTDSLKIQKSINDFFVDPRKPIVKFSPFLTRPSANAHGHVWKILVNGKDAQDEYAQLDPLGVGRQKVEVFFNRAMDKTKTPFVSMGVRFPFTQTAIGLDGTWNAAGDIYTAFLEVGVGTGDGINRLRVEGARDLEWFDIPIEDSRFNVLVDAAGSLSGEFSATPGLGRIDLDWESPEGDVSDLLGYNMYRYELRTVGNAQVPTDTTKLNKELLSSEGFQDVEVVPGKQYFYGYKFVRTNLTESDYSKIISATALTAEKGDVNGDLTVNVLDVVRTISHIIGEQPKPFIEEAADMNSDTQINVLDVVKIISKITTPGGRIGSTSSEAVPKATLWVEEGELVIESEEAVSGIQLEIKNWDKNTALKVGESFRNLEMIKVETDSTLVLLLFNFSGETIAAGKNSFLTFEGTSPEIKAAVLGGDLGRPIMTSIRYNIAKEPVPTEFDMEQNKPNPFTTSTTINYKISSPSSATLQVFNTKGEILWTETMDHDRAGKFSFEVNPLNWARGIYLYRIIWQGPAGVKVSKARKMIYTP